MTDKAKRWMFMALIMLCIGGLLAACGKNDDEEKGNDPTPTPSDKTIVSKEYKDYLTSSQMKSDVETTIEGAMKLEALKWEMYKNFTNNFQLEGIKEYDPWNTPDWDHFYELATEFGQNADRYIEAMQNLHDKGVLTSNTPKTRMFTAVVGGYLKVKDALYEGQEKVLNTMKQPGMNNNQKWEEMFNSLQYSRDRLGCDNWHDWRNKLVNREAGIIESTEIFEQLSQNNTDFKMAATEAGYGNDPVAESTRKVGGKLLEASVDVYGAAAATGSGAISLAKDAYDVVNATGNLVKSVKNGDSQGVRDAITTYATVAAGHVGGDQNNYVYTETFNAVQTAYKNTIEKNLSEAEAAENGANAETGAGVIEVEDKDTKSPGNTVFVQGPEGKTNIGLGKGGKTKVPISGSGTHKVTTIDSTGDKNTTDVKVNKKGTTTKIEVKTNESELIDAQEEDKYDWDIETDPEELVFSADADMKVLTVYTEYRIIIPSTNDDWIDVDINAHNVYVSVTENKTGKVRKGKILLQCSDDGKKVLKTATVNVTQMTPEAQDLSFINFNKLQMEITTCCVRNLTDYFNVKFNHDELSITRKSDDLYSVSARRVENKRVSIIYGYDDDKDRDLQPDPNYYVSPDIPYGTQFEINFDIEAAAPWLMIDENNFRITNLKIKGYHKTLQENVYTDDDIGKDYYTWFEYSCSGLGIDDIAGWDKTSTSVTLSSQMQECGNTDEDNNYVEQFYPFSAKLTEKITYVDPVFEKQEYKDEEGNTKKRTVLVGYEKKTDTWSEEEQDRYKLSSSIKLSWY